MEITLQIDTPRLAVEAAQFVAELARQGLTFRAVHELGQIKLTLTGGF